MSIVPPEGFTSWSRYAPGVPAVADAVSLYTGRLNTPAGRTPVLFMHGAGNTVPDMQGADWQHMFNAYAGNGHPVVAASFGGTSQWATTDTVGTGGFIDAALAYVGTPAGGGVRTDKVVAHGISMGSLNALNWGWRNSGKLRAMVLAGPIVNFEKFYNDNPVFQALIDADWGGHPAFLAGLPTSDPWRNIARVRPFGHLVKLWYAENDEFIDPEDVIAYAELIGAEAEAVDTNHVGLITQTPPDLAVGFALDRLVARQRAYVGWDDTDWGRFDQTVVSYPGVPHNVTELDTRVAPGGRRGQFIQTGPQGSERHAYLLREVSAPDLSVSNIWFNNDAGVMNGQHGNIPKGTVVGGQYLLYMMWSNILFNIPWWVNAAVWSGTAGADNMVQLGPTGGVIPGLRLDSGGEVLASSRAGGIVTLVAHKADLDRNYRSGIIDVVTAGALGNFTGANVARIDDTHLQYPLAGADVTSGGPGSWADFASCFPYRADTQVISGSPAVMRGRFYRIGRDIPEWDDPDFTLTWTDSGTWGPQGYGNPGEMFAHVGANTVGQRSFIEVGPISVDEL